LNTPATLAIDTFDELWNGGTVLHISRSDVESLEQTPIFDPVFGTVRGLEVPIAHFSDVVVYRNTFLSSAMVIQRLFGTVPKGRTSATIRVSRSPSGRELYIGEDLTWTDQFAWEPTARW